MYMGKVYKGRRDMGGIGEKYMSLELEMWQWNEICRLMDNQEKREEERWKEFQGWMKRMEQYVRDLSNNR